MARSRPLLSLLLLLALSISAPAAAQQMSDEELNRWTDYILELERRVSRHNDDPQLMLRLADAYVRVGDLRRGAPALERLADMRVEPVRIALLRGDLFLRVGDFDQAVRAYLEVLSREPRQSYALSQLWRLMLRVTLEGAEVSFDRAAVIETLQNGGLYFPERYQPTASGPDEAARLIDRASALLMRDRSGEAIVMLTRAISLDPGNAEAFATLARAYRAENDPGSAFGASLVYLLLAPDAPDAAQVRRSLGRHLEQTLLR